MSHSVEPREKSKLGILILLAIVLAGIFVAVNLLENRVAQGLFIGPDDEVLVLGVKEVPFSDQYRVWAKLYDNRGKLLWQQDYSDKFAYQGVEGLFADYSDESWSIHLPDRQWQLGRKGKIDFDTDRDEISVARDSQEAPENEDTEVETDEGPMDETTPIPSAMSRIDMGDGRIFYIDYDADPPNLVLEENGSVEQEWNLMKNFYFLGENPQDIQLVNADKGRIAIVMTMEAHKEDFQVDRPRFFRFSMVLNRDGTWNEDSYQLIDGSVEEGSSSSLSASHREPASSNSRGTSIYEYQYAELQGQGEHFSYSIIEGKLIAWEGDFAAWDKQVYLPLYRMMEKIF